MVQKNILILFLFSILIVLASTKIGMFWDNVLFASKMANPLFINGIFNWGGIPLESNPGHPPFLATLMAIGWKLFGKSLYVSHWIMLPFIFGLLLQISNFVKYFVTNSLSQFFAFTLVIADPTLLSQLVLVNPEIIQLFFFFLALNATLGDKKYVKIIALAFLGIVSFRGMMLCAGIFLIDISIQIFIKKRSLNTIFTKKIFVIYFLAALPAVSYLIWSFLTRGWIISNPLQQWGSAFKFQSYSDFFANFLTNIVVLVQRFTDFGRIIPIIFILFTLFIKPQKMKYEKIKFLLIIVFLSTIIISITSLIAKNPMGHRYFIASYLTIGLLSFVLILQYKIKKIVYIILLSSLLLGNFIVYSDSFAQGWDASLAHIPYWKLRKNAIEFMDKNQLPISKTASFFPNKTAIDNIDLNGDMRSFVHFSGNENFVLYSNVFNLTDNEMQLLNKNYFIIKTFKKGKIRVEILQKNNNKTGNIIDFNSTVLNDGVF